MKPNVQSGFMGAILALVLVFCLASPQGAAAFDLEVVSLDVVSSETSHRFDVEIARTPEERAQGLMNREHMEEDAGMLFVFEQPGERYFWMKDTPLSLDIIFIDETGEILRIAAATTPFSEKIIPSRGEALYVLEVLAGTSEKLGFDVGDKVLSAAMRALAE